MPRHTITPRLEYQHTNITHTCSAAFGIRHSVFLLDLFSLLVAFLSTLAPTTVKMAEEQNNRESPNLAKSMKRVSFQDLFLRLSESN